MKSSDKKVSGVLHQTRSAKHFQLRRYQPEAALADLVEQFWLVDWDLRDQPAHNQQNLPDPNMHLVINMQGAKVMGPVSKKYRYTMQDQGKIIGVKFNLGVLANQLPCPLDEAIDMEFEAADIFEFANKTLIKKILQSQNDKTTVALLGRELLNYAHNLDPVTVTVQSLAEQIKNNSEITRVERLAELSQRSVRNIQRMFKTYVGLSPKWLLRKYRLHHALEMLENQQFSIAELAANLDYADQSHLIRDFNEFLNVTPKQYISVKTLPN